MRFSNTSSFLALAAFLIGTGSAVAQDACAPLSIDQNVTQIAQALPVAPSVAPVAAAPGGLNPAEVPQVLRSLAEKNQIRFLGEEGGLRSYVVVQPNDNFITVHVPPSGTQMIVGIVYDAQGRNTTTAQMKKSPWADELLGSPAPAAGTPHANIDPEIMPTDRKFAEMNAIRGVRWGTAPIQINAVIDTRCGYSRKAFKLLKPFVDAGQVSVNVIPTAALANAKEGVEQAIALLRGGAPAVSAWAEGQRVQSQAPSGEYAGIEDKDLVKIVLAGTEFVAKSGFRAVPGFTWRDAGGAREALGPSDDNIPVIVQSARQGR